MVYRIVTWIMVVAALSYVCTADAQIQNPGVIQIGTVVAGNCVKWVGPNQIADAGAPCGSGGGACTGTVDFSTGCVQPSFGGM